MAKHQLVFLFEISARNLFRQSYPARLLRRRVLYMSVLKYFVLTPSEAMHRRDL